MTEQEINTLENQKTIATFMGGVRVYHPLYKEWGFEFSGNDLYNIVYGSKVNFIRESSLAYDSNWNHLIVACAKIKIEIETPIDEQGNMMYNNIFNGLIQMFNIYLTFLEVAIFIKWHNQNSNP